MNKHKRIIALVLFAILIFIILKILSEGFPKAEYANAISSKLNKQAGISDNDSSMSSIETPDSVEINAESYFNGVKLSWTESEKADGYNIYISDSKDGEYTLYTTTNADTLSCDVSNLTGTVAYYFKVVPYIDYNGKSYEGEQNIISEYAYGDTINSILSKHNTSGKSIQVINSDFEISKDRESIINQLIQDHNGNCSFIMLDIKTATGVSYNADWSVAAASTVKAPYIYYILKNEISTGNTDFSDQLTYYRKFYDIGTGIIINDPIGSKYTIETLIHDALYYSDNIAYYMLMDRFGVSEYNSWLRSIGCNASIDGINIKWGSTTASDLAKEWYEIFRYICEGGEYADFLRNELSNTEFSPIRDILGNKYEVSDKYGGASPGWHDAGIIYADDNPYILILLTDDDYEQADLEFQAEMIAQLNQLHDEMTTYNF